MSNIQVKRLMFVEGTPAPGPNGMNEHYFPAEKYDIVYMPEIASVRITTKDKKHEIWAPWPRVRYMEPMGREDGGKR